MGQVNIWVNNLSGRDRGSSSRIATVEDGELIARLGRNFLDRAMRIRTTMATDFRAIDEEELELVKQLFTMLSSLDNVDSCTPYVLVHRD